MIGVTEAVVMSNDNKPLAAVPMNIFPFLANAIFSIHLVVAGILLKALNALNSFFPGSYFLSIPSEVLTHKVPFSVVHIEVAHEYFSIGNSSTLFSFSRYCTKRPSA